MAIPLESPAAASPVAPSTVTPGRASAFWLTVLGLVTAGVGVYFLLNSTVSNFEAQLAGIRAGISLPSEVVNLQRLTLGQTFTIVGAIFLAAAWRPR